MAIRDKLRRLERDARGEMVTIPQPDGTVRRFPESELASAFLDALDRAVGRADPAEPPHPLCVAAHSSSDPTWRGTFYASVERRTESVEDLSE